MEQNCLIVMNRLFRPFVIRGVAILENLNLPDWLRPVHFDSAWGNKSPTVIFSDADGIARFSDLNKPRIVKVTRSFRPLTAEVDEMVFLEQHRQLRRGQVSACCIKMGRKDRVDRYAEQSAGYGN